MTVTWERQGPGWYTSALGGVCRERNGRWYFYPAQFYTPDMRHGPFVSLTAAKRAAEGRSR